MSWLSRLETGSKDVTFIPADAAYTGYLPRTGYPYKRDIREGLRSNVIMAPVLWVTRNFTEADPIIERRTNRLWEADPDHPLDAKIRRPNPFYSGRTLWKATLVSWLLDGNGYWQKVRNRFGEILGYWYIPHFLIEPRWPLDGSTYISHYEYRPLRGGPALDLPVRDVVHFRFEGLDPENDRKGLSSLKMLLREIFTDEEASNFAASILRNMGVPGGVIAPTGTGPMPKQSDVEEMKRFMRTGFTGDKRGEWLVLGSPTSIQQFGFDPNQLLLANLRDITEERVCALLGIPAAVVGFGAGMQQTKVGATMRELRQAAWHNALIPMQNDIADQGSMQLVPDFNAQVTRFRLKFDRSMVSVFQEEETERARRLAIYAESGVIRVDTAQELAGLPVDPSQNVYLRPSGVVAVKEGDSGIVEPATTEPAPSTNGTDPTDEEGLSRNRIREIIASMEEDS